VKTDRPLQLKERREPFIRMHDVTFTVVAVCIRNEDRSPVGRLSAMIFAEIFENRAKQLSRAEMVQGVVQSHWRCCRASIRHGCQAVNLVIGITAQEFAIDIIWEETALSRRAK
jgi:hypothetical protein